MPTEAEARFCLAGSAVKPRPRVRVSAGISAHTLSGTGLPRWQV